jgi:hypothetical protein
MDSDSDVSAATKHLFGDGSVLQLQSDFVRGTIAAPDRLEECPVILDNVELPSEVDLEKQWLNLEKRSDVVLPWEKGVWKHIFGNQSSSADSVQANFTRPLFAPCPELVESVAEGPSKKLRTTTGAEHWKQVVSSVDAMSWKETQDAKLDTAIKRWYDLVLRFPLGIAVKDQISLLAEVSDQLRVLRDIFATKSPLTLIKRANSLQRYVNFLDNQGLLFPGDEAALYKHFCMERDTGSPPSRLQAVVEALRFTEHVLGVAQLGVELLSKRVIGASKFEVAGPRRQASPFAVKELKVLHSILESESQDIWDRVMAGATLCAVYSRSRWSDLQHAEKMEADPDCWEPQFLEFTVREHKTKRANAWMEGFLPAVAVAVGISDENWARQWIVVRARVGADILDGYPVMPAPGPDGEATQRPISSDEMGRWVRMLLERHGISLDGRKITSHSCKSTLLSYMAKFGCGITTREILGGHVSHLKSVLTYSRDGLAGPLRELEQVLESIRAGKFFQMHLGLAVLQMLAKSSCRRECIRWRLTSTLGQWRPRQWRVLHRRRWTQTQQAQPTVIQTHRWTRRPATKAGWPDWSSVHPRLLEHHLSSIPSRKCCTCWRRAIKGSSCVAGRKVRHTNRLSNSDGIPHAVPCA